MADSKQTAIDAPTAEYEAHLSESLRRTATHVESILNLLENARYIEVWKKLQGVRDSLVYNMDVLGKRAERLSNESDTE